MKITQSPCVADALFGTKTITVNGKAVGIARLCDAIAEVHAMGLSRDDGVRTALLARVGQENYIPGKLREEYADALLAEYRRTAGKDRGADRS